MRNLLCVILLTFVSLQVFAQEHTADNQYACSADEIAFDGNDLVSYHTDQLLKGKEEHTYEYQGLKLRFASWSNMDKFIENPDKYLPAYGGWCAIAVANGTLTKPDFSHFQIQDDKLYFFEVRAFFNGQTAWNKDPDINKIVADKKYEKLTQP